MLLQGLGNRLFTWATGTRTHMRSTAMKNLSASKACVSEIDRRFCTLVLFIFCCYYCQQAWCPQPRIGFVAVSVGVLKQAGVQYTPVYSNYRFKTIDGVTINVNMA